MTTEADPGLFQALAESLEGEVRTDTTYRRLYATDASHFERMPAGVVLPRHAQDCTNLVQYACEQRLPLIPRGGGTGLCGQTVGDGLVVDTSRHLCEVLDIDATSRIAQVQPGVIPAELNRRLQSYGLRFAPDPSTLDRCTLGGMHGNNAWGSHAPRDGSTRDHVVAAEGLIGDGSRLQFGPLNHAELRRKLAQENSEGHIYRTVHGMIEQHRDAILASSPDPQVTNNTGYALDVLARGQPWVSGGEAFNLTRLLSGAEGTLALLTQLTVRLVPIPATRGLLCLHFDSLPAAFDALPALMALQPAALELLDRELLALTAAQPQQRLNRFWVTGSPEGVLMVEFSGERGAVDERIEACRRLAGTLKGQYAVAVVQGQDIDKVFALRRAALGLLMGKPGRRKTATVIEDSAVPIDALGDYITEVRALMHRLQVECLYYGSLSRGLVHLRPWLDLNDPADLRKFVALPAALSEIVARYRGAFSTKHGDGRLRAPWLETACGREMVQRFREIKRAFDPHGILNPGKILDPPPLTEDLRRKPVSDPPATALYSQGEWQQALGRCNGAGACRKRTGTMCPSYMATRDEMHATRGRANLLRIVNGESAAAGAADDALALCLSCKACRRECPANVDMARIKAEWQYQQIRTQGMDWRRRLITGFSALSRLGSRTPRLANALLGLDLTKLCLGVDPRRRLPRLSTQCFSAWFARRPPTASDTPVVLLIDPHTEYYEPEIGQAAVRVLERLGMRPLPTPCVSSGRVEISQGALDRARLAIARTLEIVERASANEEVPVIGLEPSELLTWRDEAPALAPPEIRTRVSTLAERAALLDEFLARQTLPRLDKPGNALVHAHCHQKALGVADAGSTALTALGWRAQTIESPCCGMAGYFGYQHYEVSIAVGNLAVLPAVRAASDDTVIVANGVSCRQQIAHATQRKAQHIAQVVAAAIDGGA